MSNYLRNLKFSAYQLKPGIFRAQSCPTIGFYSCADQICFPSTSALTHIRLSQNVSKKKPIEVDNLESLFPVNDFCCEVSRKSLTKSQTCRPAHAKSALSLYHLPAHSLLKFDSQIANHVPDRGDMLCPLSSFSTVEAYLCEQLKKDNVTVLSGFLEASPYHVFCVGADNRHRLCEARLSEIECRAMRFADAPKPPTKPLNESGRPSEEQLHKVYTVLSECLPRFFVRTHNYSIYHQEVIFENAIRGVTTRGLSAYVQQLTLIRILGHLRYASIGLVILKMTQHPEDGTVRVRWRIKAVPGMRVLFMFWKFRIWQWGKMMSKEAEWIDGFSIFHVGGDGLVFKHICDKMMPDENREVIKDRPGGMAMKLALMLGLLPDSDYSAGAECGSLLSMLQKELH